MNAPGLCENWAMPNKNPKKSRPPAVALNDSYWEQIMRWLNKAHPATGGWAVLFQELQALIASLLNENNIAPRIRYFEKAVVELLGRFAVIAGTTQEIDFQLRAGRAYENFGAWEQALAAYQRAVELSTSHRFMPQKIEALRWIGNIQSNQNKWQLAEQAYQESLQLSVQNDDATGQAQAENSLGILYFEQGEFEQAAAHWTTALELAEKMQAKNLMAVVYNDFGALANVQGQWEKALAYYGASLPQFEITGDAASMASTYHNMAMSYADKGNWMKASINYEKSYRLARQLGNVHLQALVKLNRVELYLALGDAALAEELCRQALQTYRQLQDHLGEADACKFLGIIAAKKRAWTKAKAHFEQSLALAREFNYPLGEAEARWEYGRMLKQKGAATLARAQLKQALALFRKVNASVEIEKVQNEITALKLA